MASTLNGRRILQGTVISTKMNKTVVVEVKTYKTHPKYKKRVQYTKKYHAHDEHEIAKDGDFVLIAECRPISKTKHFRVVKVIKKGE